MEQADLLEALLSLMGNRWKLIELFHNFDCITLL